jgi:hypothetical protein
MIEPSGFRFNPAHQPCVDGALSFRNHRARPIFPFHRVSPRPRLRKPSTGIGLRNNYNHPVRCISSVLFNAHGLQSNTMPSNDAEYFLSVGIQCLFEEETYTNLVQVRRLANRKRRCRLKNDKMGER